VLHQLSSVTWLGLGLYWSQVHYQGAEKLSAYILYIMRRTTSEILARRRPIQYEVLFEPNTHTLETSSFNNTSESRSITISQMAPRSRIIGGRVMLRLGILFVINVKHVCIESGAWLRCGLTACGNPDACRTDRCVATTSGHLSWWRNVADRQYVARGWTGDVLIAGWCRYHWLVITVSHVECWWKVARFERTSSRNVRPYVMKT